MFLVFEDRMRESDLLVMPIELNSTLYAKTRQGHFMKYGRTQEIKIKYEKTKVRV